MECLRWTRRTYEMLFLSHFSLLKSFYFPVAVQKGWRKKSEIPQTENYFTDTQKLLGMQQNTIDLFHLYSR